MPSPPASPPPQTRTEPKREEEALPVSQATDVLLSPHMSTQPRYRAYRVARARFWEAFPGGRYVRLPTPGSNLECGFHALRLSMRQQYRGTSTSIRLPTLEELRGVFFSGEVAGRNGDVVMDNEVWFTADQLAAVFSEWGRRYLSDGGLRCQLGYVTGDGTGTGTEDEYDGVPVMMNTPDVDTAEEGGLEKGIVRVWVYNDGASLRGGVGHFEGIRRPVGEEKRVTEAEGG